MQIQHTYQFYADDQIKACGQQVIVVRIYAKVRQGSYGENELYYHDYNAAGKKDSYNILHYLGQIFKKKACIFLHS